jgi:hypothetical protein
MRREHGEGEQRLARKPFANRRKKNLGRRGEKNKRQDRPERHKQTLNRPLHSPL